MIGKTLESLSQQAFSDFEYIVIDGSSKDRTLDIIQSYENKIRNMCVFSEPDKGIYDAMNKGVRAAKGEYVYFLNAGDVFESEKTLSEVASFFIGNKDLYYGSMRKEMNIEKYPKALTKLYLVYREKMICHQAIFAKRKLFLNHEFDTDLKICADRDWLIRILGDNASYYRMKGVLIGRYDTTGVSMQYDQFEKESLAIAAKYGGYKAIAFIKAKRFIGKMIRHKR